MALLLLCLALCVSDTFAFSNTYVNYTYVETQTIYGQVRGMRVLDDKGGQMDVFLGLPFATPPVGSLRFAAPKHPEPWEGVLDATHFRPSCAQNALPGYELPVEEDCLYLNIFAPYNESRTEPYPVLFYLHGGAFFFGSGNDYDGSFFTQKDVIFIGVNYRLDAFGFLCTGDAVAPGNFALMDNTRALEWVRDNIQYFGGDPNSVTIHGQSAGAVLTSLITFSTLSQGLFHRVMSQSGSSLNEWAIYRPPYDPTNATKELALDLGCPTTPSQDLVNCLRTKSMEEILDFRTTPVGFLFPWSPVIDGSIIKEDPRTLLERGEVSKVPKIMGSNLLERYEVLFGGPDMTKEDFDENVWNYTQDHFLTNHQEMFDALVYEYTEPTDDTNTLHIYNQWCNLMTDCEFISGIEQEVTGHSMVDPNTYYYTWHYRSDYHPRDVWQGCGHSYELYYEFAIPFYGPDRECPWNCSSALSWTFQDAWTDKDREMSEFFITMITNYAKYGDPTVEPVDGITWETFDDINDAYLLINDTSAVEYDYRAREMLFWQDYLRKVAAH